MISLKRSLNSESIKKNIFPLIKVTATVFISSAIVLELWHIYAMLANIETPSILSPLFWLERLALISHGIEGIIAAFYAPSKKENPIKYGVYTFFVGTVGLVELFQKKEQIS
jgi:hypothetical protein